MEYVKKVCCYFIKQVVLCEAKKRKRKKNHLNHLIPNLCLNTPPPNKKSWLCLWSQSFFAVLEYLKLNGIPSYIDLRIQFSINMFSTIQFGYSFGGFIILPSIYLHPPHSYFLILQQLFVQNKPKHCSAIQEVRCDPCIRIHNTR